MKALYSLALLAVGVCSTSFDDASNPFVPGVLWDAGRVLSAQVMDPALPKHKISYFDHLPAKLHYFDGSSVVAYTDEVAGDVYISETEGKDWRLAEGIPRGAFYLFIEHPFDANVAFVLTRGTTHYRTNDRGATWQSFDVPLPPSVGDITPLSFHAGTRKSEYILYQGDKCDTRNPNLCYRETYYTKTAFADGPKLLVSRTSKCLFGHSSKESLSDEHGDLVFCVETPGDFFPGGWLRASSDFFVNDKRWIDPGDPGGYRDVFGIAAVSKFLVVTAVTTQQDDAVATSLYVTANANKWERANLPHDSHLDFSYTLVGSSSHALTIDIQSGSSRRLGSLFISNANGTAFVESLRDTHRSDDGFLDYMDHPSVRGVSFVNHVHNAREVDGGGWNVRPELKTKITWDGGSSWGPIKAPASDTTNGAVNRDSAGGHNYSLHLHLNPHLGPSSRRTPPGFILAVGSVSETLLDYEESDTYLSRDAGSTWTLVRPGAHSYAFGDHGNIIILVDDEKPTDHVRYSIDSGTTWENLNLGVKLRIRHITTAPSHASQSFVLVGLLNHGETNGTKRVASIYLDFGWIQPRECGESDMEIWYITGFDGAECVMGQKQGFWRRKSGAECYIGDKSKTPKLHSEQCLCTDADYGCDYNYARKGDMCILVGPEPIPAQACDGKKTYEAPSGYRLIPGNACKQEGGIGKDGAVMKNCTQAEPDEGEVAHQIFRFPSPIIDKPYFLRNSTVALVQTMNDTIWQSDDEGSTWRQPLPEVSIQSILMHPYSSDRGYLFSYSDTGHYYYTTDGGRSWNQASSPWPMSRWGRVSLTFHPKHHDYVLWTADVGCSPGGAAEPCHTESAVSWDHGRQWKVIEKYVDRCLFAEASGFQVDRGILCASYHNKTGHQHHTEFWNPLELVIGHDWYEDKRKLFDHIVGIKAFEDSLFAFATDIDTFSLDLHVSVSGGDFVKARLPPDIRLGVGMQDFRKVTQPAPDATFLQVGISDEFGAEWGALLKSDPSGTNYGLSLNHIDRALNWYGGYFEQVLKPGVRDLSLNRIEHGRYGSSSGLVPMPGVYGVALVNILTNPKEAVYTRRKKIQTRITYNDGGLWQPIRPPVRDSNGELYDCSDEDAGCSLHLHSSPPFMDNAPQEMYGSLPPGMMLAAGNVGKFRGLHEESDLFITRDAGFTWEEVHKGAYMWAFGDSGSILVIADRKHRTRHLQYTTDYGLHWKQYDFGVEMRVTSLSTAPESWNRRFILIGDDSAEYHGPSSVVVHLNFDELTRKQCDLNMDDAARSDFEVWSPNEGHEGQCFLGAQMHYYRRKRSAGCFIGYQIMPVSSIQSSCECMASDFECEYNHVRNGDGDCVIAGPLFSISSETSCKADEEFWYEETAYRKISKSLCKGGIRLDRGAEHYCRVNWLRAHKALLLSILVVISLVSIATVAYCYHRRRTGRRGPIHLSDTEESPASGVRANLVVMWFSIVTAVGRAWNQLRNIEFKSMSLFGSRSRNQAVALDEDT